MKIQTLTFVLLFISFTLGNLYHFSFFSPQVRVSFLDISVIILTLVSITGYKGRIINKPVAIFAAVSLFSLILATRYGPSSQIIGGFYWLRWVMYASLPLFFTRSLSPSSLRRLIIVLALVIISVSWLQYFIFPDIRPWSYLGWDLHYYRVVGSFLDPGFTGLLLVFTIIYLTLHPFLAVQYSSLLWGLNYLALAFTYSRSSYLAFLVAMAYIARLNRSLKFFTLILLLFTLTIFWLPRSPDGEGVKLERINSIQARIDSWRHGLIIWRDHPMFGVGFNVYRYAQKEYNFITAKSWQQTHAGAGVDSSLLFVAATTGIIGLAAYLYYLNFLFSFSSPLLRASLLAALFHSLFLNSLFYPFVFVWLNLIISLSMDDTQPPILSLFDFLVCLRLQLVCYFFLRLIVRAS